MGLYVQLVRHDRTGELYITLRDHEMRRLDQIAGALDVSPVDWRPCVHTLKSPAGWTKGERFTVLRNVYLQHTDD